MKIHKSIKTRLDPNQSQRQALEKHAGTSRFVYNWGLEQRKVCYEASGKGLTYVQQNRSLTDLKRENPWMYEVSKWVGQDALRRLDAAFSNFFNSLKKRKPGKARPRVGFPKFKKKSWRRDSFSFPGWSGRQELVVVHGNYVHLPVLGLLKVFEYLNIPGRIVTATVSREGDLWFISLTYEVEIHPQPNGGPAVGIDLGISHLATLSDGTVIENPRHLKKSLAKIKRLQRWVTRKLKGSANRRKAAARLARWHRHVANQRQDLLHQLTTWIARNYSVVCLEDLNVAGMSQNHALAQSILDAGWSEFRRQLTYKTVWNGGQLVLVDRFLPSSQVCSQPDCGYINEQLTLADRVFQCPDCGFTMDRDLNAAINIRTAGLAGIACGPGCSGPEASALGETASNEAGTFNVLTSEH
jgi:putative transposase